MRFRLVGGCRLRLRVERPENGKAAITNGATVTDGQYPIPEQASDLSALAQVKHRCVQRDGEFAALQKPPFVCMMLGLKAGETSAILSRSLEMRSCMETASKISRDLNASWANAFRTGIASDALLPISATAFAASSRTHMFGSFVITRMS